MFAVTVYVSHYLAAAHYNHAVAHAENLRHFRGNHDDAFTGLDQAVHDVVNLNLCTNVNAARGLVKDENIRFGVDPLADNHLLLVTAGKLADNFINRRRLDAQGADVLLPLFFDFLLVEERPVAEALHIRQDQVVADALGKDKALALTVLREERNTRIDRLTGALDRKSVV